MQKPNYNTITDYFHLSTSINLFVDGNKQTFVKGDDKYELLLSALLAVTKDALDMPAYAVAENNGTVAQKNKGTWIELDFLTTYEFNELPFDALLIEVNNTFSGFNLIRKQNGKYDGRCFYLRLQGNMQALSDVVKSFSKL